MDQLVKLVSQKTGLSPEMSEQAVRIVIDYLKQNLPQPLAAQIDNVISGKGGQASDIAKGLGGLLG